MSGILKAKEKGRDGMSRLNEYMQCGNGPMPECDVMTEIWMTWMV